VLLESRGTYPLQVLRPHVEPSHRGLSLIILLLSGGLLDGDRATMEVVVEPGARLALRTQSATQVHSGHSEQHVRVTVAEDGWFSYVPHAVVPHAGADYYAQTRIALAHDARALIADLLTPGRVQFGECFAYHQVRLDLDVTREAKLVARERAVIRPNQDLHGAMWGKSSHVASAYLLGPGEAPQLANRGPQVGATELANGGWFVRALADRASDLDDLLIGLSAQWWQFRADACICPGGCHTVR
jgi:urease accessory protein UreH